jgi:hypothetical protein
MRSAHNPGTLIPKHAAVGAQVVAVVGGCRRASALRVLCLCRRVLVAARPQRDRRRRRDYDRGRRSRDGVRVVTLEMARSVFHHSLALAPMGIRPSTSTCTVHEIHGKGKTMPAGKPHTEPCEQRQVFQSARWRPLHLYRCLRITSSLNRVSHAASVAFRVFHTPSKTRLTPAAPGMAQVR